MPKKKDENDIEALVDNAFDKKSEQLMESMQATEDITQETLKFLGFDELWEACASDRSARLMVLSISGYLTLAAVQHGGEYLDFLLKEDEDNKK